MGKYTEIGSEFWLEENSFQNVFFALSGRTAIDLVLQDLIACGKPLKSVYMPAWCCESMLQPFLDRGVTIYFYDVIYDGRQLVCNIEANHPVDILYICNYFGYASGFPSAVIEQYHERGVELLYDRTHSLFMKNDPLEQLADYSFASIRKWLGVPCGAYLRKKGEELHLPGTRAFPYLEDKIDAMVMKGNYMGGNLMIDKMSFLNKYSSFGHHLTKDYRNYKMDAFSLYIWNSVNKESIRKTRRENARYLQQSLNCFPRLKLMFRINEDDCPLFVPILLDTKEERDALRKHLISNSIYCPIHWPKPSAIETSFQANNFYNRELSLICDQRYSISDMQQILDYIKYFFS